MKPTARASAVLDTAVIELAKRVQRKRLSIATHPLAAGAAPVASGQGWLRKLGLSKIDSLAGPEFTLAKMMREWQALDSFYSSYSFYAGGSKTPEEKEAERVRLLNDRIGLVEYRVFGLSPNEKYPSFTSLPEWLAWRLPMAHPDYRCEGADMGWTPALYEFAVEDAKLSFPRSEY